MWSCLFHFYIYPVTPSVKLCNFGDDDIRCTLRDPNWASMAKRRKPVLWKWKEVILFGAAHPLQHLFWSPQALEQSASSLHDIKTEQSLWLSVIIPGRIKHIANANADKSGFLIVQKMCIRFVYINSWLLWSNSSLASFSAFYHQMVPHRTFMVLHPFKKYLQFSQ